MKDQFVVGLVGRMRAGKTTAATALVQRMGFVEKFFAEPLKSATMLLFRMSRDQLYTQEGKETVDSRYGVTPRRVMQWLGQAVRDEFPGLWEMRLVESIKEDMIDRPIVVSDIRYDAEAEAVRSLGGVIIEIVRPESISLWQWMKRQLNASFRHKSERGIKQSLIDVRVINDGDIDDLNDTIVHIVKGLMKERKDAVQETTH